MLKIRIILLFCIFFLFSCSNKSIIYTFYTGKGGLQYFVKPSEFKSSDGEVAIIDFTYQDDDNYENDVICNFTLESNEKTIAKIDSAFFVADNDMHFQFREMKLLFREIENKKIRYSGLLEFSKFKYAILSEKLYMLIYSGKITIELFPTKSFYKAKEKIILEIIRPKE